MKTKRLIFITEIIVISLLFSACLKEDELVRPFTTFKPVAIDDGWTLSYPSAENIDSMALVEVYTHLYAHEKAWMVKIEMSNTAELNDLMDTKSYQEYCEGREH